MSWQEEFGKDYEVPGLIEHMVKLGILEDFSWHNDSSPSFVVKDPEDEERGVRIWIEHPVKSIREFDDMKRFLVQYGEFGRDGEENLNTDDLEEAILILLEWDEKYHPAHRRPHFDKVVKDWRKTL